MDGDKNCSKNNSDACACLKYIATIAARTESMLNGFREVAKLENYDFNPAVLDEAYESLYQQNQELRAMGLFLEKSSVPKDELYHKIKNDLDRSIKNLDEFLNGVTDICAKAEYRRTL